MATLYDNKTTTHTATSAVADRNAELHNSGIGDAYRFLTETVDRQLSDIKNARLAARTMRSSTIEIERPTERTAPTVAPTHEATPYKHERVNSDLFRAETLDRAIRNNVYVGEEVFTPTDVPVATVEETPIETTDASVSLSAFAKTVMAVFATVVVMMFTMICINTQILNQKAVQIEQLEQTHSELVMKNIQLRKQIEDATSEEAIEEFALANGMVRAE